MAMPIPLYSTKTAEYNLLSASEGAMAGGVFAYKDSENYGKCVFDSKNQKLIITLTASGREEVYEFDTVRSFDEDVYDALDGTDWLFGYFVGLSEGRVVLGKQYYAYTGLASASAPVKSGQTYELKAVCRGAKIEVYLDGELLISYTDPNPFIQGSAGIRTCDSRASFEAFSISE